MGAKTSGKWGKTSYQDRVRGLLRLDPSRIEPFGHHLSAGERKTNWRTHGREQKEVFRGVLEEYGVTDGVKVWVPDDVARAELVAMPRDMASFVDWAERYKGTYQLVDGHLRRETIIQPIPALVLDVNWEEAQKVLALHDAVGGMAGANAGRVGDLLDGLTFKKETEIGALLAQLEEFGGKRREPMAAAPKELVEVARIAGLEFTLMARGQVERQKEAIALLREFSEKLRAIEGVEVALTYDVGLVGKA